MLKKLNHVVNASLQKINLSSGCESGAETDDEYSSGCDLDEPNYDDDDKYDVYTGGQGQTILDQLFGQNPTTPSNNLLALPPSSSSNNSKKISHSTTVAESQDLPVTSEFEKKYPGLKKPSIEWIQTDETVLIQINVTDIKDYYMNIGSDKKTFTFRTIEPQGENNFKITAYMNILNSYNM